MTTTCNSDNIFKKEEILKNKIKTPNYTLQPPDLSSRSVTLLISGCNSENDGRFGGGVDVSRRQGSVGHSTLRRRSAIHAHKRQLGWAADRLFQSRKTTLHLNTFENKEGK